MNSENLKQQMAERKPIEEPASMPNIRLDYEVKINPNFFETLNHFTHWISKYITDPKYFESNLSDFCIYMAYCYPDATTLQLLSISQAMTWAFVCDDQVMERFKTYEEAMEYVKEHMRLWDEQNLEKAKKFCVYCGIIMAAYQAISDQLSPRQKQRFREAILNYLEGSAEESFVRNGNVTVEEFIRIRRKANGSGTFLLFVEMVSECDMSPYVDDEVFKLNEDALNNIVAWINDLYSFNREQTFEARSNLVYQVKVNDKLTAQAALDKATKLFFHWIDVYNDTSKQMIEQNRWNGAIPRYIKCADYWFVGNRIWNLFCRRYTDHNQNIEYKNL